MVHIPSTPIPRHVVMLEIPPPPNATPIVPPAVISTNDGMAFRQWISRRNHNFSADDNSTLVNASGTILVINVFPIKGYVYDANGNRIS